MRSALLCDIIIHHSIATKAVKDMFINPETFGIVPGSEVSGGFINMFNALRQNVAKKNVKLQKGTYYFSSENASSHRLFITNTIGEEEYKNSEEKNIHKVALYLHNLKDLQIDAQGSTFILDGRLTNIVIDSCENITIKNLKIKAHKPDIHKLTVLTASSFYATFRLDNESDYAEEKGKYYWYGTDYKTEFLKYRLTGWWTPTAKLDNLNHLVRNGSHPLKSCVSLKEIAPRVFKVRYISPHKLSEGQVFYIFSCKRKNVGIFAQNTKNIVLKNVTQSYSPSLSFVAQNCEDIFLDKVDFSPEKDSEVDFTSVADFVQICMCRGKIKVSGSNFDGAGDDTINVHGINFKITEISKNKIYVKFCHPQSYGFLCFRTGDDIALIDSKTLLEKGNNSIVSSRLLDLYTYELILENEAIEAKIGDFVENISACPDFEFSDNTVNRIVTRGLLVTTRGKVLIQGNRFLNTGENGILISDDASGWFESGPVRDVTIRSNAFMNCDGNAIFIRPENKEYAGAVHENILIENNLFCLKGRKAYNIKDTKNVVIRNNSYMEVSQKDDWVLFDNVSELSFEDKPYNSSINIE